MPTRPTALTLCAGLVLLAAACAPPDAGTEDDTTAADTASYGEEEGHALAAWTPKLVEDCSAVDDYLEESGMGYDTLEGPIEIHLNSDGELAADPEVAVVARGQRVQFSSDDLRWAVQFVNDRSPMRKQQERIRGQADGVAQPQGDRARVPADAKCGRYHYVVGAYSSETDSVYVLDPPIIVKD